jgi:Phage tail assembly chaperone proteins, E, or 41 or 14
MEITLKQAIPVLGGQEISVVKVNEPTAKILKTALKAGGRMDTPALNSEYEHALVAGCTGLQMNSVECLLVSDFQAICEAITSFLSPSS